MEISPLPLELPPNTPTWKMSGCPSVGWATIDSAPKDGSSFLAFGMAYAELADSPYGMWGIHDTDKPLKPFIAIIRWYEHWDDEEIDNGDGTYRKQRKLYLSGFTPHYHAFRPSHWMPLPAAPK
jgi:hypothetical protein